VVRGTETGVLEGILDQYKREDGHVRVVRVLCRQETIGTSQGTTAGARSEPDVLEPVNCVGHSCAAKEQR
jgi:hypothetical protein